MREILFRGKRKDNGEWVEGNLFVPDLPDTPTQICIGTNVIRITYDIIPETVGQFTGLTDKNGKWIFEGDILKIARVSDSIGSYYFPPLVYPVNVIVKWDLCAWMWETLCKDKRYIGFPDAWCHYNCEVIGNVHDNPELLKQKEE